MGDGLTFELELGAPPLALGPFIARLGHLAPWPPNPLLRPADDREIAATQGRPLAAWYLPREGHSIMSWLISPPLEF